LLHFLEIKIDDNDVDFDDSVVKVQVNI